MSVNVLCTKALLDGWISMIEVDIPAEWGRAFYADTCGDFTSATHGVFNVLRLHATKDGHVCVSNVTGMRETGLTQASWIRHRDRLEQAGWLTKLVARGYGDTARGALYRLSVPDCEGVAA